MTPQRRKANNALGAVAIFCLFLWETVLADHFNPNPLSPVVWSVLGFAAVASLGAYFWLRAQDKGR